MENNRIEELIQKHLEIKVAKDKLESEDEAIKAEIKLELKERALNRFEDSLGNLVSYTQQSRESLDKERIKELLGEITFNTVVKKSTFDVLKIISKDSREKMKAFIS